MNLIAVSFALLAAGAQATTATTDAVPAISARGAFFALSVPDIEASAKWYEEKFGLSRTLVIPKQGKFAVVVLEGGGLIVELIENDDAVPLAKAAPAIKDDFLVHGYFKAGVILADYEKTLATLKERGVEIVHGPYPPSDGQRANVIVRDNAGNLIHFFKG